MRESEMTQNAIQHVASLDFEHITIYLMNNTNNHFNRDNEQRESTMSEQTIQSHGSNNNSNKRIQPKKKNSRLKVGLTTLKQKLQRKKKNNTVILWLQDLPLELMMLIFSFLDCRDLWNKLSNDPKLWLSLYNRDFLVNYPLGNKKNDWKGMYKSSYLRLREANKTIKTKPYDCESYLTRALVHIELKHFRAAQVDLTKALELKVEKRHRNKNISMGGLLMRRASVFRRLKESDRAKYDADCAIRLEPSNCSFYRIRGNWAREDNRLDEALEDFNIAIALDPEVAVHYFCRGLVYKEKKDYTSAILNLDRAIELEPNNPEYYCSRGRIHSHLGNCDAALADLNKAVELDPHNSDYLHWRGRIRRDRHECVEAMRDFERALQITKDDIDYAWRGIMHSHLKNNDAALKDIDQAIALAPHNSFHYQFRGILNFGLERNAVALENFNKAIELLPNWAGHYVWRAAIFYELRDFESTLRDLDTAVNLKPDEVSLFWRGLFYLDRGEILKALYDLYSAYKEANRPIHSRIVFWLGVAQLLASHIDEALHYFDECARLSAADERKVARYTEPARLALLTPILNWVKKQTPSSSSITPCTTLSLSTTSPSNSNSSSTAPTTTSHPPPPHSTLTNNNNNENSHPTTKRQSQVKKSEIISFPYNVCCRQEDIDSGVACAKGFYEAFFKSYYTVDNAKTENTHLELLARLFPSNKAIARTLKWYTKRRRQVYSEIPSSHKNNSTSNNNLTDVNLKLNQKVRHKDHIH